jgi:hypothetical protein
VIDFIERETRLELATSTLGRFLSPFKVDLTGNGFSSKSFIFTDNEHFLTGLESAVFYFCMAKSGTLRGTPKT